MDVAEMTQVQVPVIPTVRESECPKIINGEAGEAGEASEAAATVTGFFEVNNAMFTGGESAEDVPMQDVVGSSVGEPSCSLVRESASACAPASSTSLHLRLNVQGLSKYINKKQFRQVMTPRCIWWRPVVWR